MLKWFENCQNVEEAKTLYRELSLQYHPDLNGIEMTENMAEINVEFEQIFNDLKTAENDREDTAEADTPEEFMKIINGLIHCEGVNIDLVGNWIWLTGNTYQYKDVIKGLGFKWSRRKNAWYWRSDKYACRRCSNLTLDEVKAKYGCTTFPTTAKPRLQTSNA